MQPDFYPHPTERIELLQTHISYIFITGDFVYKVKKPFNLGFLDFTDLDRREYYCREEIRLNRRLAPDTYLDVVEIYEHSDGRIVLGKGDRIIEYAVKMKILPRDKMLNELLSHGTVKPVIVEAIARKLADFHENAETGGEIDEIGGIETIRKNHNDNFIETEPFINVTIPEYQHRFIKSYAEDFLVRNKPLFHKRVADHRIRNCHGDLHLEHICVLDSDIVIFDCIEFDKRFRYNDVAAEVAFLAMDLENNGYHEHGERFVDAYIRYSRDSELRFLLNFYKCYYAYVRGKVTSLKLSNSKLDGNEQAETKIIASRYFDLAYAYAAHLEKPALILMAGLMGTGKSKLAKWIAPRLGASIIQTDTIRKEILNIPPTDHRYEAFGKGIYTRDMTRLTYEKTFEAASEKLKEGKPVIIDASFKNREERTWASEMAEELGSDFFLIECVCQENIIMQRLEARMSEVEEASDGRWEIFQAQKESFEPISEIPEGSHIVINTSPGVEESAHKVIQFICSCP